MGELKTRHTAITRTHYRATNCVSVVMMEKLEASLQSPTTLGESRSIRIVSAV